MLGRSTNHPDHISGRHAPAQLVVHDPAQVVVQHGNQGPMILSLDGNGADVDLPQLIGPTGLVDEFLLCFRVGPPACDDADRGRPAVEVTAVVPA